MITPRDNKVIEFIEAYKTASTSTICELFYPSLRVAQMRLKKMYELGEVKRTRYYFMEEYVYFHKKNNQFKHNLILTDFYRELHKRSTIIKFKKEFTAFKGMRSDGFVVFEINGCKYIAFVEVELSHKGFDISKYKQLYLSEVYKEVLPVFPLIIIVTDYKVKEFDEFDIVKLDTGLKGIDDFVKGLRV